MTGEVIRASKTTAARYERDRPGELVHVDVKKIGRIPHGGGWRVHGRKMGSTSKRKKTRIGYDYIHSAVDDHTRLAYSETVSEHLRVLRTAGVVTTRRDGSRTWYRVSISALVALASAIAELGEEPS